MGADRDALQTLMTPSNPEELDLLRELRSVLARREHAPSYLSVQRLLWAAFVQQFGSEVTVAPLLGAHRRPQATDADEMASLAQRVLQHVLAQGPSGISYRDLASFFHDELAPPGKPVSLSPVVDFLVTHGELVESDDTFIAVQHLREPSGQLLEALVRHAADRGAEGVRPSELAAVFERHRGPRSGSFSDVLHDLVTLGWLAPRGRRLVAAEHPARVHRTTEAHQSLPAALARIGAIASAVEDGDEAAGLVEFSVSVAHRQGSVQELRKRLQRSITQVAIESSDGAQDARRISIVLAFGSQ
jgi:hypothetical protein